MHHNIPPVDGPILQGNDLLSRPVAGRDYPGFYELLSTDRGRYVGGPLDEDFLNERLPPTVLFEQNGQTVLLQTQCLISELVDKFSETA